MRQRGHGDTMVRRTLNFVWVLLMVLSGSAGLIGCTPWPMEATGGLAERHPAHWGSALQMDDRYQRLFDDGVVSWAPSRMMDARIMLARARREYTGDLFEDAQASLRLADGILTTLEHDQAKRPRPQTRLRPGT